MNSFEFVLTLGGIAYGTALILAAITNSKALQIFRLELLLMRTPAPSTRYINIAVGMALVGYYVYSIMK